MNKTKTCSKCGDALTGGPNTWYCAACKRGSYLEYKEKYPDRVNTSKRKWEVNNPEAVVKMQWRRAATRVGVDPDEVVAYVDKHNGLCDICGQPPNHSRFKRLSVDHAHDAGHFRGLLCNLCNQGLGLFKDDTALLLEAIRYLVDRKS